jgi:hypothetical protein
MVRVLSLLAVAVSLGVAGSCSGPTVCSDVGCNDEASFTIRAPGGHWDDGAYSLQVTFGHDAYDCTFTLPDALPSTGSSQGLDCTPTLQAYFTPEVDCEDHRNGNDVSEVCTPIADQYYLQASRDGTPAKLAVTLQRDDTTLLDETRALSYSANEPNGPECGPTCRQASIDFTLP